MCLYFASADKKKSSKTLPCLKLPIKNRANYYTIAVYKITFESIWHSEQTSFTATIKHGLQKSMFCLNLGPKIFILSPPVTR